MPFRGLLQSLVDAAPGARGAVFCDSQGENVDLALARCTPALSEFDLKVCGAQMAAEVVRLQQTSAGALVEARIVCEGGTLLCRSLPQDYYVVLLLDTSGRSSRAGRLLARTAELLAREM